MKMPTIESRIAGCLIGGAVGDAVGLPFEGQAGPVEYSLPENWRLSDDTQLTLATCESLVEQERVDPEAIAEGLCSWFREGRIYGIGASTLKALRELDAGGHWALVGRKGEMAAGNGAAMRIAPLGFMLDPRNHDDRVLLRDVCRITHHSDEAYVGALAVVAAIHFVAYRQHALKPSLMEAVSELLPDSNVRDRLAKLTNCIQQESIQECGMRFGTSGFVADSVPLALAAVVCTPTLGFEGVVQAIIECGGDTDTTASMAGQMIGAASGIEQLPAALVDQVPEIEGIRKIASRLFELKKLPYSSEDLSRITDEAWPNKGEYCEKCRTWIPRFADLTDEETARLRSLSTIQAMKGVREATGCSLRWAKIWAMHPNGPEPQYVGPPCPHCGEPLRTAKAQQCLSCGADWH